MRPTRVRDDRIATALRTLDAAPPSSRDEGSRARADALLQRILSAGGSPPGGAGRDPLLPRPRTGRRLVPVGLAAGVAAVGIAASQFLGGATAYAASWTPTPSRVSQADAAAARQVCTGPANSAATAATKHMRPRLAERRGDLVLVAMDDGAARLSMLTCLVVLPPGGDAELIAAGGGGGERPTVDDISALGTYENHAPGDELAIIDGLVGEDVVAVTVHAPGGRAVEATVEGGHYAAWWPGPAMRLSAEPFPWGVESGCRDDCDGAYLVPTFTVDVTLEDGTVLRNVTTEDA